jgi:RNA polymerase sigma-70 factor (ECF subfamily)
LTDDEESLVRRAQAGERAAFRALYDRHAPGLYRAVLLPLVRDPHLAEDILADTFVRAIEKIDRFTWQGRGMFPWLARIARNLALDHLRRSKRSVAWPHGFERTLPTPDPRADDALGQAEVSEVLAGRIAECMDAIKPRYAKVLRLRLVERRARAEAAAEMEVTVGTLDVLLHRACRAFRREYTKRFDVDENTEELFAP